MTIHHVDQARMNRPPGSFRVTCGREPALPAKAPRETEPIRRLLCLL